MKKRFLILICAVLGCSLCGCNGATIDMSSIESISESVSQFSESIENVGANMEQISEAVTKGVESSNSIMDWCNQDNVKEVSSIASSIDEEKVESIIQDGKEEAAGYLDRYIDEDAVYDILSAEEIDFFSDYFNEDSANGFLMSTYENPNDCDLTKVFSNGAGIENAMEEDDEFVFSEEEINSVIGNHLGLTNAEMSSPLKFKASGSGAYTYVKKEDNSIDFVCCGGFHYNNVYLVMMCKNGSEDPFSLTVFEKINDYKIAIKMNYWSEDMSTVEWDGSFLYQLYDMMLNSNIISEIANIDVAGLADGIGLDYVTDAISSVSANNIEKVAQFVGSERIDGEEVKTYMQNLEGYEVYYTSALDALEDYVVSQIIVTDKNYITDLGISIGDSKKMLELAYGKGKEIRLPGGRRQISYEMDDKEMQFTVDRSGDISEICIYMNVE